MALCCCLMLMVPLRAAKGIERSFVLSEFGGHDGQSRNWWRGYKFRVKENITVTALRGGATNAAFELAIFPLEGDSNNELKKPMAVVPAPSSEKGGIAPIDSITLSPNKYYFVAQGSQGSDGSHYRAKEYRVNDLKRFFRCIGEWEPSNGKDCFLLLDEFSSRLAKDMDGADLMSDGEKEDRNINVGLVAEGPPTCMCKAHEVLDEDARECTVCPSGKIPSDDQNGCEDCQDYEIAGEEDTECFSCPNGTIPTENQDVCIRCKAYEYATTQDSNCTRCPNGTIPNDDQGGCIRCKPYEFATTRDTNCTTCPNGTVPSDDQGDCIHCKAYEFATTKDIKCTACPNGTVPSDDQDSCVRCKAHEIATQYDDVCKVCPNGTAPDDKKSACQLCPRGTYSLQKHTQCKMCRSGYYNDREGSCACAPCKKHSYQPWLGQSSCLWCSRGRYQFQLGQTTCIHWTEINGLIPLQRPKRYAI